MNYKEKLKKIKNFVFDVDGVFTDGSIVVDSNGNELRMWSLIGARNWSIIFFRCFFQDLQCIYFSLCYHKSIRQFTQI